MTTILLLGTLALAQAAPQADAIFRNDVKEYVSTGDKIKDLNVSLTIGTDAMTITRNAKDATVIPFEAITGATYDRRERQRKIMGLPSGGPYTPKRQHFLTVQFKRGDVGDFVELELGKDIAARVVATLEARSGKPVEKIGG